MLVSDEEIRKEIESKNFRGVAPRAMCLEFARWIRYLYEAKLKEIAREAFEAGGDWTLYMEEGADEVPDFEGWYENRLKELNNGYG